MCYYLVGKDTYDVKLIQHIEKLRVITDGINAGIDVSGNEINNLIQQMMII